MRRLLAVPDARRLIAGEGLSMLGDRAMFLVLAIWAKDLTGSNAAAGLVFFAFVAPMVAGPLGGLVADRVRRRPLMIATDLAIGSATLLLLLVRDEGDLWILYLVAALYGVATIVFAPAQTALLKAMLPEELLADANAILQTLRESTRLLAPLIGAALYALWGGGAVAVVDALTFGVSALALASLTMREQPPEPRASRLRAELVAGARHIWQTLALRQIVAASALALLVIGFTETAIFAVVDDGLGRDPSFFGVLAAIQGAGAVAGGLVASRLLRALGDARLIATGLLVLAVGCGFLAPPSLTAVAVGQVLFGAGISWAIVGYGTAIQVRSPLDRVGRVYAAAETLVTIPQTVSIALGAALIQVMDYRLLLAAVVGTVAASALYLGSRRDLAPPQLIAGRAGPTAP
jgi:Na+/melibiose symporter-like transporter